MKFKGFLTQFNALMLIIFTVLLGQQISPPSKGIAVKAIAAKSEHNSVQSEVNKMLVSELDLSKVLDDGEIETHELTEVKTLWEEHNLDLLFEMKSSDLNSNYTKNLYAALEKMGLAQNDFSLRLIKEEANNNAQLKVRLQWSD